jgi:uncharacterized protein
MRFWDSSAIVPALIQQHSTKRVLELIAEDKNIVVSWLTYFECYSALTCLEREGLSTDEFERSSNLLDQLKLSWITILQSDKLAREVRRVLRIHPLKCADAIQLGSALVASNTISDRIEFCCLDAQLSLAARKEGLTIKGA